MKDRLKALLAGPLAKFAPLINKWQKFSDRTFPHIKRISRWMFYTLMLPAFLLIISIMAFFFIYPANELKPWAINKIQHRLHAEKVSITDIRWDHSLIDLSLGVRIDNVSIEKASWLNSFYADNIRFSIGLGGFITKGLPFQIELDGLIAESMLKSSKNEVMPLTTSKDFKSKISFWAQSALGLVKGYRLNIKNSELRLISEEIRNLKDEERFDFFLKNISLEASVNSSWKQVVSLDAIIQAGHPSKWAIAGPLKIQSESHLKFTSDNNLVALVFDKFEADLKETNWTAFGVIERIGGERISLSAQPNVFFKESENETSIESIQLNKAKFYLDDLGVDVDFNVSPGKETSIEWVVGRSEVQNFYLPIKGLRRGPGKGVISSSGKITIRNDFKNSEAQWRLMLNNYRIDSSYMAPALGDRGILSGELKISFVSEGSLTEGSLKSPHSELQIDASEIAWIPASSELIKPSGNKALMFAKLTADNNIIDLSQFDFELHTLKFKSSGKTENLLNGLVFDEKFSLDFSFNTNNVNLSEWSSMLPGFKKNPLQGFFQVKGKTSTDVINVKNEKRFDNFSWNFDRLQLSQVRGGFAEAANLDIQEGTNSQIEGPFEANLFFVGRGIGTRVDQARLIGKVDFSDALINFNHKFRKPKTVPLLLEISANQSRNRMNLTRGELRFANLDLGFSGSLIQGMGRSKLDLKMNEAIDVTQWRNMILDSKLKESLKGSWLLNGSFGLNSNLRSEKDIDWSSLTFEGDLIVNDFAWNSELFGEFNSLSGRLKFLNDQVQINKFTMFKGSNKYLIDGLLRPIDSKRVHVSDFFSDHAWETQINLEVPKIEVSKLLVKMDSIDRYSLPEFMLTSDRFKNSRISFNLNIADATWEENSFLKNLLGKLDYAQGRWTLRPFSAAMGESKFQGSASIDLNPFWLAKKDPQWAASLKSTSYNSRDFPLELGFLDAMFGADLTLTTQGRYLNDWKNNLRMRGLINIKQAKESLWLNPVGSMVKKLFAETVARDYLLSDAKQNSCLPIMNKAMVELHWHDEKLKIERMRHDLYNGGRLDLEAVIERVNDSTSAIGKAAFKFSNNCFSESAKTCFDRLTKNRGWILDFSTTPQPLDSIKYAFELESFAENFKSCMAQKIAEKVSNEISKETKGSTATKQTP